MITYNPASLFYFTTCLRLDDSETELYHSILETLTRENNTEQEILSSIKNIILSDATFQIYSFPFVLNQLSKLDRDYPTVKQTISEYFNLFSSSFDKENETIASLINEVIEFSLIENVRSKLIKLSGLAHFFHSDSSYNENSLPYIDIVEFGTEAITLDLLNYFCENKEIANYLSDYFYFGKLNS